MNSELISHRVRILRIMVFIFWLCALIYVELPHFVDIDAIIIDYHYFVFATILFAFVFAISFSEKLEASYQSIVYLSFWGTAIIQMLFTLLVNASTYNMIWMIIFLIITVKSIFNLKVFIKYGLSYFIVLLVMLFSVNLPMNEKIMVIVVVMVLFALTYLNGHYEKVLRQWNDELHIKHGGILAYANEGFALHKMIFDEDGNPCDYKFLELNQAFTDITGLPKEIVGKSLRDILPESETVWIETYAAVVTEKKQENFIMKSEALKKDFQVSAYPFGEDEFVTLFLDISERVRNQERLRVAMEAVQKANFSKARFLQDVNHRLRTPLNGMMGMAQLFDLSDLSEDNRELYDAMYLEMKHSKNIINQIAQYVQIEDMDFIVTKNDVVDVIQETIEGFNVINRKRITFRLESCMIQESFFEKSVLQKILLELIDNGLKYSADMVEVVLSDRYSKERNTYFYMIRVIDHGRGIKESDRELIFNELYHHDFVHIYKNDNNISLALCKHLAENIGASLTFKSEVNRMTEFVLEVPAFEQS